MSESNSSSNILAESASPSLSTKLFSIVKTKLFAVVITGLILVCVSIGLFYHYQSICSYASLQGYWHITDNIYLLIDDNLIQFVELKADPKTPYSIIFEDTKAKFKYSSFISLSSFSYVMKRSSKKKFDIKGLQTNPFNAKDIHLEIFPASGIMQVSFDGMDLINMTKDNGMSFQYLSSHM